MVVVNQNDITMENCHPSTLTYVDPIVLNLQPSPVVVKTGQNLTINFVIALKQQINKGANISVQVKRLGFFDLVMPCMNVRKRCICNIISLFMKGIEEQLYYYIYKSAVTK